MTSTGSNKLERPTLTDFLRANTHFILDPIVALFARLGISPDALSLLGFLAHFLFAWLIIQGYMQWTAAAIFFLASADAVDGALARKIGRIQGGFGAFLDSTLDRIAEFILFAGFLIYFYKQGDNWLMAAAYLAVSGSLMVSYARAKAETLGYTCKVGLLSRVERYVVIFVCLLLNRPDWSVLALAVGAWFTVGQRAVHVWRQAYARR